MRICPLRLDWRHVRQAHQAGVVISINTDAHHLSGLDHLTYGIGVRKGWLTSKDVLNTLDVDESPFFARTLLKPSLFNRHCGPSCAGKTTLARGLVQALPEAVHFPLDAYYADLSDIPLMLRAQHNFDHPDALDYNLLLADLQMLANGQSIHAPVYDFHTHTRQSVTRPIAPPRYLLVEACSLSIFPYYALFTTIAYTSTFVRRPRIVGYDEIQPSAAARSMFVNSLLTKLNPYQHYIIPATPRRPRRKRHGFLFNAMCTNPTSLYKSQVEETTETPPRERRST